MSRRLKYQSTCGAVAYQADITIAVRGATQLTNLQKHIEAASASINKINRQLATQGILGKSINNLQKVSAQASQAMRSAAEGTVAQKRAIDVYVKSLAQAEKAETTLASAIKKRRQELGLATETAARTSGGGFRGRIGGAVSGSIIGGSFPLLFGQGGGAAAGGAVGGLIGGLAGPGGSFAGSLLGTLLGDIASRGQAVQQLAEDIGFSVEQTRQLSEAFKVANTDVEKFTSVIQNVRGLGLELEDQAKAIQLVTRLTELYGGSFEKTGNAITGALESGKVNQATLNQLTSQGINVQQALADKFGVSRNAILKMAKDGKISVQSLIDTLVSLGNEGVNAATKPKTAFQQFTEALKTTGTAVANLATQIAKTLSPVLDAILIKATNVINTVNQALAAGSISTAQKQEAKVRAEQIVRSQAGFLPGGPFGAGKISVQYQGKTYTGSASGVVSRITNDIINSQVQAALPKTQPQRTPLQTFTAPSQAAPSGSGSRGARPPKDRTAQLLADLDAMKLMSITQDGIRDALFEGNKELAIQLEYDQKIADITRDTAKALMSANYESEKAVIRAQEIVRIKDAQLERDDQLRELARDVNEIITNTLEDLRGGISWDDTGMREIFDMRLPDAVKELKDSVETLTDPANQIIGAATAIGDAFAESFKGIISGAVTARQGLSNFFKSIGNYFIDMAARIAAEALKLQGIQILQSLLSPLLGSGFGIGQMNLPGLQGTGALSTGNLFPTGAFAEGGFVTKPTGALIGEGGEPEYVIPASKMRTAMARYAGGARGDSVVSGDGTQTSATGATATMEPIDVRYSVERINNVDYVTADQFQAGMRQAAQQGAAQGETRALRKLQMSSSTRRRVGI